MKLRRASILSLIVVLLSIIAAIVGVVVSKTTIQKVEYGIFYLCIAVVWFIILYLDIKEDSSPRRGFEVVGDSFRKHEGEITLPTRSDSRSAGYDFYAPTDYKCEPHKVTKIWTDVKAYMKSNEVLLIDVRSSMGGKFHLANTIGVIDSSYFENESNDGNIGVFLVNDTDEVIEIKAGERIAQGLFLKYLTVDNDHPLSGTRTGGFGSSGK